MRMYEALKSTEEHRKLLAAMMALVWEALGLGLAYAQGQLGEKATWIGRDASTNLERQIVQGI